MARSVIGHARVAADGAGVLHIVRGDGKAVVAHVLDPVFAAAAGGRLPDFDLGGRLRGGEGGGAKGRGQGHAARDTGNVHEAPY
ncbi:hypothetical protein G6F31_015641 [Rhizopus arrhizus]|nr:hypothetical protein G6F31_015641 [Rhizopus arrhizus]